MPATKRRKKEPDRYLKRDNEKVASYEHREVVTVPEAADFLRCARSTLQGWISKGYFTWDDGLRKLRNDLVRIHFPTLRTRYYSGTLMSGAPEAPAK